MIEKGKEFQEKEIMDYLYSNLANETEKEKKKRKRVIDGIIKNQNRMYMFHYLTWHAGKGVKGSLRKLIIKDKNGELKILLDQESIKTEII